MLKLIGKIRNLNLQNQCSKNFVILINKKYSTKSAEQIENEKVKAQKVLNVAVIGVPNAGKSTFINSLINHRVCPTSSKVHTTRRANKAIYTEKNTQIILYDTPGLVTKSEVKKYSLNTNFSSSQHNSIQICDMIAVIHDVSNKWTRHNLHETVVETLKTYPNMPSFLVLNKIDLLKSKRILLDLVRTLTNNTLTKTNKRIDSSKHENEPQENTEQVGWSQFSNIYMISSLHGNGVNEIMKMLLHEAKAKEWAFPANTFTDETPENIIVESVRARLLDYLPQEIPYRLQTILEYFENRKNSIYASVQIICPNLRYERLLCGESNGKLKQITERITSDLVETFNKPISLTLSTQVSKAQWVASNQE